MSIVINRYVINLIRNDTVNSMQKSAKDAANLMDMQINTYIKQVEDIASRFDIRSMNWDTQKLVLTDEAKRIGFERFQVGYPNGDVISTTGHTSNAADREFFKRAINGQSNISDVLFARIDLKMVICVSAPIYDLSGKIAGILTGVTSAKELNTILDSINLDYTGSKFVINKSGQKMAGFDYTDKETLQSDLEYESNKDFADLIKMEKEMIKGKPGTQQFSYQGSSYYAAFTPMNNGEWFLAAIQSETEAEKKIKTLSANIIIMEIISLIAAFILSIILGRIILKPLNYTTKSFNEMAESIKSGNADLTKTLKNTTEDEAGELIKSYNVFVSSLHEIISKIKNTKQKLTEAGTVMDQSSGETTNSVDEIIQNINKMQQHVSSQTDSVNETAGTVNQIVSNIGSLEKMIESQNSQVQQASSAVEQMIGNIVRVNKNMEKIEESFDALRDQAKEGESKQQYVNERITEIEQQSSLLQEANQAIAAIAEQTNLLAMNAAIEAAHAGESGKGFSVVADEIRKLSETSSQQSKTIGDQLNNIMESITTVVSASALSSASFKAVSEQIEATDELVKEMTTTMEEQENGSEQIKKALRSMTESSVEVRSASQEMALGSKSILEGVTLLQNASIQIKEEAQNLSENTNVVNTNTNLLSKATESINSSILEIGKQIDTFVL